jgi:hypothetical protein
MTQVVAGPWILSKEPQTHAVSSTEQLVVSAMALSRQGRAHEGISARDWAATRPAAAARRTAEYFILKVGWLVDFVLVGKVMEKINECSLIYCQASG